jgi:hypothetical protein
MNYAELMQSYLLVQDVYGSEFDRRMAQLCLTISKLEDDETDFKKAAAMFLATKMDDHSTEANWRLDHATRAAIVWYSVEVGGFQHRLNALLAEQDRIRATFKFEVGESAYIYTNDGYEPCKVEKRWHSMGINWYQVDIFGKAQDESFLRKS